jgi:lysophospholipase L1-like esterase
MPANFKTLLTPEPEQTLREIVHVSLGGQGVRIRVSNAFGKVPLRLSDAHVAVRDHNATIVAATDRALTFNGEAGITIPAGADVLSDSMDMAVPAHADLAVSLVTEGRTSTDTGHFYALQTSYTAPGDQAAALSLRTAAEIPSWAFLSEVQVANSAPHAGAVVAFGDSITDGAHSTADTNGRWPDRLSERLAAAKRDLAVTDAGIVGNRLLHDGQGPLGGIFGPNALARFDRDVLAQAGVRDVIVLLGINDIGQPGAGDVPADTAVTSTQIEGALRQIAERAHEHQIRVIGATLLPFEGTASPGYYSPEKESKRQAVNAWIRTSGVFDGVADFDKAVQDPKHPARILPEFDGGDHLHPSDAGMKAMAGAVPLDKLE